MSSCLVVFEQTYLIVIAQTWQLEACKVIECAVIQDVVARLSIDWSGVIMSDINLPGNSGLELFEDIKKLMQKFRSL